MPDVHEGARQGQELRAARARHQNAEPDGHEGARGGGAAHHAEMREREGQQVALVVDRRRAILRERREQRREADRKSTRLNSSHLVISYAVFCLKKKKKYNQPRYTRLCCR